MGYDCMRGFSLKLLLAAAWVSVCMGAAPANAGQVLVAAASSMKFVFDEAVPAFERKHPGIDVKLSYGSSGNLYSLIKNGAPYDLYFSADMEYPRRLAAAGLGDAAVPYAVGKIVIWTNSGSGIEAGNEKMRSLLHPKALRIAIANPRHAPYGRAALEAMRHAGLLDRVRPRLVMGENVTQAAQFVHTGAAQVGIIALSLALTDKLKSTGTFWEIPDSSYRPIEQGVLLLARTRHPEAAKAFADFVTGSEGREILTRYGFGLPE